MSVHDFTLYDVLERNARSFGDRLAVVSELGDERDFSALKRRVDRLGAGLHGLGLEPGDRVAVLALNSAFYFELYLACARQGLVIYPLNWRLTADELDRILARAQARVLFADAESAGRLSGSILEEENLHRFQIGARYDSPIDGFEPAQELLDAGVAAPPPSVGPDRAVAAIATAAVDIVPRCALLSHRNLLCSNLQEIAVLGLQADDRSLLALPLFHIAGLGHAFAFLHAGGANVILPRFHPEQAVTAIDQYHVTHLSDFPPVLASLLDAAEEAGSELDSLRHVTGLDSPETIERLHRFSDATFWTGFGQTETTGLVTLQNARERSDCAGKPAELCRVDVVDALDQPVPVGETGEIVVRGPLVFLGYDGQDDVTEHTFRNDWHHTGDLGRFDEEGNLFYAGRKPEKQLIKPGGENVYPAEVESVIAELDGVTGVCVFGVPDDTWGEAIKAVIELAPDADLEAEAVIEHVGSRIARYKRPKHVELVADLPRDAEGAVDAAAVAERWGVKASE